MRLPTPMTLAELAQIARAKVSGDPETAVRGVASLERAGDDELSFVRSPKWREAAAKSRARALLVGPDYGELDRPGLVAPSADAALARLGEAFLRVLSPRPPAGVHPSAVVAASARLGEGVSVGPCAVIEEEVSVGARSVIGALVYLGRGVRIGEDTVLHPNVTVLRGCRIGSRCEVHPGACIGGDGFGFIQLPDGSYRKLPQLGDAVIEDDVEIGSCSCVDRATLDSTVVGRGVKLDNLVHVAHNVTIGPNTVMAALVGIAGSSKVGAGCQFGGQSGLAGHLTLGDGCRVGAGSPVVQSFEEGGLELWGFPAREKTKAMREMAAAARSEATRAELRRLRARVEELEKRLSAGA